MHQSRLTRRRRCAPLAQPVRGKEHAFSRGHAGLTRGRTAQKGRPRVAPQTRQKGQPDAARRVDVAVHQAPVVVGAPQGVALVQPAHLAHLPKRTGRARGQPPAARHDALGRRRRVHGVQPRRLVVLVAPHVRLALARLKPRRVLGRVHGPQQLAARRVHLRREILVFQENVVPPEDGNGRLLDRPRRRRPVPAPRRPKLPVAKHQRQARHPECLIFRPPRPHGAEVGHERALLAAIAVKVLLAPPQLEHLRHDRAKDGRLPPHAQVCLKPVHAGGEPGEPLQLGVRSRQRG